MYNICGIKLQAFGPFTAGIGSILILQFLLKQKLFLFFARQTLKTAINEQLFSLCLPQWMAISHL
jgi:hypothetical protein